MVEFNRIGLLWWSLFPVRVVIEEKLETHSATIVGLLGNFWIP